jgi:lipid II:glycine glycyltransferase (peptidoglycan interpeptide bridge formation enzyme)
MIQKTIDIEPSKTAIVNLQKNEDELLSAMHQKTRYNIRLAEKKGVVVRVAGAKDFDEFWRIMKQTVKRDEFRLHDRQHYQKMLALDNNFIKLFLAEYQGKVVAAVLASFFGDMITYIHGASADEDRNVMAPYLLHWQIMKIGKAAGYKYYDLNGADESKWPGVTRFKMGFGGETVEYPGTYDLILNKVMYNIYQVLRKVRRMV